MTAGISAQRAIRLPSLGQRPRKVTPQRKRPEGPVVCLRTRSKRPTLWALGNDEESQTWADGPGYVNGWAFGPESHEEYSDTISTWFLTEFPNSRKELLSASFVFDFPPLLFTTIARPIVSIETPSCNPRRPQPVQRRRVLRIN